MKTPVSTYRLQMSPDFTFEDLTGILDYLDQLGVSTIYSAPFFKARKGSTHGYDVVDPFTINPAIGKLEQFREITEELHQRGMTWLQDIVPNHMAFDSSNPWLRDIFELGPDSRYYNFFDINWGYKGWNKVMAPFLGGPLEEILKGKELKLKLDEGGLVLQYYDHVYPVAARSYEFILKETSLENWYEKFKNFAGKAESWQELKTTFFKEAKKDRELEKIISRRLEEVNDNPQELKNFLELQYFKPVHWQTTEREINYRRFFTINDLICLSMENGEVFDNYHYFIKEMLDAGLINGLRVDHIDGLFDPEAYTQKLRNLAGREVYLIVEKILEADEKLPVEWPVQGTSGYEFLAQINHVFTASENKKIFSEQYHKLASKVPEYEDMVYEKKLFILKERMGGELHNLMLYLKDEALLAEDLEEDNIKEALSEFLASFPIYRIYPKEYPLKSSEIEIIDTACQEALEREKGLEKELLFLKSLLTGEAGNKEKSLYFLKRCQQFSGPLAAKGVEDTSFYIYNRLILHNEVGDSPENFGISVEEFHQKILEKQTNFPHVMNATATHDTKRGEDSRMRLAVLSEFPKEWFQKVKEWKEINKPLKSGNAPDDNEEYFIYQALIGAIPFGSYKKAEFLKRTKNYLQKVMREAKVNSNWSSPNEEHENAVFEFLETAIDHQEFRNTFDPFQQKIAAFGTVKSCAQVCVKNTVPGVPDTYQGTELWDFSYVDPDNRRPVDYDERKEYLNEVKKLKPEESKNYLQKITSDFGSGKIKFYILHKLLTHRKSNAELFENGEYIPLKISGQLENKIIAFARKFENIWSVTVAPVLLNGLYNEAFKPNYNAFKSSFLHFPEDAPAIFTNIFTAEESEGNRISLDELLGNFPVAVLINKN
ncbi:malto-oligosyltrehalose synthase [Zunongwangia sp. F363]|uniref:Malto-oligosyltrehalose synthase n=1 Tax=Autumnicola tepida TaxID=3075595 RepID=A0ABU3CCR6_9FLAO|nr:malto-oligosyltrehalose synthase [Zunongwangia sp. F363]MDT0644068.1 malto-oligosyltrehalose synthase [Zunongwangia sp. F363]